MAGQAAVGWHSCCRSFGCPLGLKRDFFYSAGSVSFTKYQVSNDLSAEPAVTLLIMEWLRPLTCASLPHFWVTRLRMHFLEFMEAAKAACGE